MVTGSRCLSSKSQILICNLRLIFFGDRLLFFMATSLCHSLVLFVFYGIAIALKLKNAAFINLENCWEYKSRFVVLTEGFTQPQFFKIIVDLGNGKSLFL